MSAPHMSQFYDIYGIWHVPWWQRPMVKNIGWVVCIILLMAFFVYIIKKFLGRQKRLAPWQVALKDLASLGTPDMLNESASKIFYTKLTAIIKQYICERYGFDIYGKTDREILAWLDDQVLFAHDLIPVLQEIFDHAGQTKFANISGIVGSMERDLALSMRLIKETMPLQSQ